MKTNMLSILLLFSLPIFSQNRLGSWNILNITLKANAKWSIFAESQIRSLSFYNEFHYYELKTGITYKMGKDFSATSGFGSYNTFDEGGNFETPIQNKEIRTWFQFNLKNQKQFFLIEHRYRAEQRFTSNGFRNRFRYRLGATIPINNLKIEPKTFYLSIWNEVFLTNNEPFFERNRLFLGFGFEINKNLAVQTGYIYQFDYKINDETGRDFINIGLFYTFTLQNNNEKNFIPATSD